MAARQAGREKHGSDNRHNESGKPNQIPFMKPQLIRYVNGLTVMSNRKCDDAWLVIAEDTEGNEYFCTFPPDAKPTWKDILEAQERGDFQLL